MVARWSRGGRKVVARWSRGGREVVARWLRGGREVVARWGFTIPRQAVKFLESLPTVQVPSGQLRHSNRPSWF